MGANITRRAALFMTAALVAYPLWKYFSPSSVGAQGVEVPLEDLPENGAYLLRDRKAAIIRRKNGIKVISIACTHLGCTLNVADDGFICPCHGSRFTLEGKVVKGPATVDLRELRYELSGNTVKLYI